MSARDFQVRSLLLLFAVCGLPGFAVADQATTSSGKAESILADLKAEGVETRRAAAEKLRLSDRNSRQAALPGLIELLMKEKDGQVRLAVFEIITSLGPDAAPAVPALIHTLRTRYGGSLQEESHQDYRAALALAAVGKPAVDGLRGLLGEANLKPGVRAEVIMSLGRIGPAAQTAIPELIGLLGSADEPVVRELPVALGHIGMPAVEPLIAAASAEKPAIRARVVESLGSMTASQDRVRQVVLKGTSDASPKVRAAALRSLARLDLAAEVVLPYLKENLRHEDEEVRMAVVDLLMHDRGLLLATVPDLEAMLADKNAGVSHVAAFLLGKLGPDAAPRLIEALRGKDSRIDQIAVGLAGIGRPVAGALNLALKDPDPRVRRGAALALGQIRPVTAGTSQRLAAGLNAPEPEVRAGLLTAIGSLGSHAVDSIPAARSALHDSSAGVRLKAIEVLSQVAPRDGRMLADLLPLLDDPEPRVESRSIDTIRGLGPISRQALPAAIAKLKSPSTEVRLAAAAMVKAHGSAASQAVPALIALLNDPEPKLRAMATQSLGMIGKPAQPAFERLVALLSSDPPANREAVISAIGSLEMDAETVRPPFRKALLDESPEVRRAATRGIQKLGPKGVIFVPDIILMAAKKENLRTVERMLRRFEGQGPDMQSLPELIKELDHRQEAVRLLAIKFLALAGKDAREAIPALERMHDDASAEVRKQADAACKRIKQETAAG